MRYLPLIASIALVACTTVDDTELPTEPESYGEDLPVGELSAGDAKADGQWGHALDCKPLPELPPLEKPSLHLSIEGLTIRLYDEATGFEKVFPVGVGVIDHNPNKRTFGESLSAFPMLRYGHDFTVTPRSIQPCKTWHTPTGVPLFAGLPFISFSGNYGIHGPIDNYRSEHGGDLRRGFVSHGCFRMASADIRELYARIKGVAEVPVTLHREPERRADGTRVDIDQKWIGAECQSADDCGFDDAICQPNPYSGRGWCTLPCDGSCPDQAGRPTTMCVKNSEGNGVCVNRVQKENDACRDLDHFVPTSKSRYGSALIRDVCLPGTEGFVGDGCTETGDCLEGFTCHGAADNAPGQCVQECSRFCPDMPGYAGTFCVADDVLGESPQCLRTCDPSRNAPECGTGLKCTERSRAGQPEKTAHVCLPG